MSEIPSSSASSADRLAYEVPTLVREENWDIVVGTPAISGRIQQ